MEASLIVFALATFVIAFLSGMAPIFSGIKQDAERLKQVTGIAAGIIIASAMLVVIPEGYELAMTDEHGVEDALAGSVALVILEVGHGDITADEGIEEIEGLIGGHGGDHDDHEGHDDHGHDEHGHESEESLTDSIAEVIEEVEDGEFTCPNPKCRSKKCKYFQLQTRSAEESCNNWTRESRNCSTSTTSITTRSSPISS